jgi:signal transduction histidine kinase
MRGAAERMSQLIEHLLVLSRLTTHAVSFGPVDLGVAARHALTDLRLRVEETAARVEIGPLPCVEASAVQMRQLLQNLLDNAIKYHRPGVPPVVHVQGADADAAGAGWVELTVSDEGIGFDSRHAERIFKPFQRLHGRGEYPGTGMGLAICRRIVERHGGRIEATAEPGAGATFRVLLPRHAATEGGR